MELFLLRLLRGAGPEGLEGHVARPPPTAWCGPCWPWARRCCWPGWHQEALPYRDDASNLSRAYLRNRMRLDLLPELARNYNPRLKQAVWRTQALLQEEERLLSQEADRAWARRAGKWPGRLLPLTCPGFWPWTRRCRNGSLRAALGQSPADLTLTAAQVAALLDLAQGARSGGLMALGRDVRVARAGAELHFFGPLPEPPAGPSPCFRPTPIRVDSPAGWRWRLGRRPVGPGGKPPPGAPDSPAGPGPGDFSPGGARASGPGTASGPRAPRGRKKLQDFLVDSKIPRWLRPHLPLVAGGGQIIWVPGLQAGRPGENHPCDPDGAGDGGLAHQPRGLAHLGDPAGLPLSYVETLLAVVRSRGALALPGHFMRPSLLLLNPWIYDFAAYDFFARPLGLLYLAGLLEARGFEVHLLDCLGTPRARPGPFGTGRYPKEILPTPPPLQDIPRRYGRYGISEPEFLAQLARLPRPGVILVTSLMTYWYPGVAEAIRLARRRFPGTPVILGGIYATLCPDHARRHSGADLVVTGPGEAALLGHLEEFFRGYPGKPGSFPKIMEIYPRRVGVRRRISSARKSRPFRLPPGFAPLPGPAPAAPPLLYPHPHLPGLSL